MAQYQISQRYLEELVTATLEGDVEDIKLQTLEPSWLHITGRIHNDGSDPEETRQLLEELVEGELAGWRVTLDGTFVSGDLPPNFLFQIRNLAHFPDVVYRVQQDRMSVRPRYKVWVRHQALFLGKKRNRQKKLADTFPDVEIVLLPLGRQESVKELNTLPRVHEWLAPFLTSIPDFLTEHVHAYKTDTAKESIWLAHNAEVPPKDLERLARRIVLATDIAVTFERKTSRADARAIIEAALAKLKFLEGYHISFQEKQSIFFVTIDAEQSHAPELAELGRKLSAEIDFRVELHIDIKKDVMTSRLLNAFPKEGIITGLKHVDASLYEVEAYYPMDPAQERLNAWSDEMEEVWGAKIMFSEPFMRAPDIRYKEQRGADAETIANRYNRPKSFSAQALADAEEAARIDWEKEARRRGDIRDTIVLSIDPARTRDIDDALSIVETPEGDYEVGVHIADVSAFVEQGSALDNEAMLRGFTTYLAEGEIPVIPEVLANSACSLHGDKDSLCISVFMTLDANAELKSFRVCRTIIHNYARLNYKQAQAILNGGDHQYAWQVRQLGQLSQFMRRARKEIGALDLSLEDDPEKPSHQLIEEYMLLANECVSRFLHDNHPTGLCLYRVHPDVTENSMAALRELAQHLRVTTKVTNQETMQKALEELLETPKFDIFRYHVGRVLEKATYHVDQLGHGALAKEDYAHFTSPIRRYTDLIIHRLIEDVLESEPRDGKACYEREDLQIIADHLNHMEVRVDAASFESHRLADLQFYDGARRTYSGRILSFMRGRMAIKLDQTDLLVYVRYRDFKQDKMMPISINDEFSSRYFSLGEEVSVRTEGVNWGAKSIDARILH